MMYHFSIFSPLIINLAVVFVSGLMVKTFNDDIIKKSKNLKGEYSDYLKLNKTEIMDMVNSLKQNEDKCWEEINNISNDLNSYYISLKEIKQCKERLENPLTSSYHLADTKEEYCMFVGGQSKNSSEFNYNDGIDGKMIDNGGIKQIIKKM